MTRTLGTLTTLTLALAGLATQAQAQPADLGATDQSASETPARTPDSIGPAEFYDWLDSDDRILTAASLELEGGTFDAKERETLARRFALAKPLRADPIAGVYRLSQGVTLTLKRRPDGSFDVHRVQKGFRGKPLSEMRGQGALRDVGDVGSKTGLRYVDVRYEGHFDGAIDRLQDADGDVVCPLPGTTRSELRIDPNTGFLKDTFSPTPESAGNEVVTSRGFVEGAEALNAGRRLRDAWALRRASVKGHRERVRAALDARIGWWHMKDEPVDRKLAELRKRIVRRLIAAKLLSPNDAFQAGYLSRREAIEAVELD